MLNYRRIRCFSNTLQKQLRETGTLRSGPGLVFRLVLVGISLVSYQPIPTENSVGRFRFTNLAGASKIGGSPLFQKKGGPRPPFCTLRPSFEEKKEFPRNFSKKEFPRILKKVIPPKLTVQQYQPTNTNNNNTNQGGGHHSPGVIWSLFGGEKIKLSNIFYV